MARGTGKESGAVCHFNLEERSHTGITVGTWTLRWDEDCWTVGRWEQTGGRWRWRDPSWYGCLDQALRRLLERCVEGDVSDLAEAVRRVERAYRDIVDEFHNLMR